ncbi:MAG: homoserine dehydrogenase, partial [Lentisphaeria bacterium]
MKTVNIGIIGFGTVGAGILDNIISNASMMCHKTGVMLAVKAIADLDITSDRGVSTSGIFMTTDAFEVINHSEVDIIVEAVGGYTFAKDVVVAAMNAGKSVVTANKALLSKYFQELSVLAQAKGVDFYYEASVGGGIPCIKTLREGLIANNISDIYGIVNGTCNYILTRMEREQIPFCIILPEAQAAGYAEADPSLDVDGFDTAHKTVILAGIATGTTYT